MEAGSEPVISNLNQKRKERHVVWAEIGLGSMVWRPSRPGNVVLLLRMFLCLLIAAFFEIEPYRH